MPDEKKKPSLSMTPPGAMATPDPEKEKAKEAFISEAGPAKGKTEDKPEQEASKPPKKKAPAPYPWEAPGVDARVIKAFNLRLSEPDFLRLKYLVEKSNEKSMHAFCARVVMEAVSKGIKDMK
ncbi:hypothetical protein [Desulfatibacillum aliphaticivorans]|uniref:hypothetical protein n=1 Tax=Desulfatibacillum aliphaticivorans TaxID=218208 RepID=UPI00041AB201|nr:hypothetical protein [Desulfatibacillum aliphaticivorans]